MNAQGLAEAGLDHGGLAKELLEQIVAAGTQPEYGLFAVTEDTGLLYPNPTAEAIPQGLALLEFLGRWSLAVEWLEAAAGCMCTAHTWLWKQGAVAPIMALAKQHAGCTMYATRGSLDWMVQHLYGLTGSASQPDRVLCVQSDNTATPAGQCRHDGGQGSLRGHPAQPELRTLLHQVPAGERARCS